MQDKETLYRTILDAIPLPVLFVDDDLIIVDLNGAALEMLNRTRWDVLYLRGGEASRCIHATDVPAGCGRGPHCRTCLIRDSVRKAFTGIPVHRLRTKAELVDGDAVKEIDLLVTASPVQVLDRHMVLLILEDISEITRLRTLIPMCSHCRRIRNEEEYWQSIEKYLKTEFNADVTHGLCHDCLAQLYPEQSEGIIRNLNNRRNGTNAS